MNKGSNSNVIGFGDSDGDNSDGDNSDGDNNDDESSYLGAYITPKSREEQIDSAKNIILYSALGLDFSVTSKLSSERKDSLIKAYMTKRNIQFDLNDLNDLTKLNQLKELLSPKKGGKRRKSKKYRKSRKQRKTKTKRRLSRSYKYK
jgi:hypothetical protein